MNEQQEFINFMLNRQDIAYKVCPVGSWWQRWVPGVCKHSTIRCVHGDEINDRNGKRRACMICGKSLKGDLPKHCFFTGKAHS